MSYSSPYGRPLPPEKGSFPLDYEGVCKKCRLEFLKCIKDKKSKVRECDQEMRNYFKCRMENNLMEPESMNSLGLEPKIEKSDK